MAVRKVYFCTINANLKKRVWKQGKNLKFFLEECCQNIIYVYIYEIQMKDKNCNNCFE